MGKSSAALSVGAPNALNTLILKMEGYEELMPRKLRELRADLRAGGFMIDHQTGSHQIWRHGDNSEITVNLAGNDGSDAKPYQEKEVRRALLRVREPDGGATR